MRECGDCTGCCTTFSIAELNKPLFARCVHVCATGCTAYDARPSACRRFECLWRRGYMDEQDRPDKLGLVMAPRKSQLEIMEVWPGAAERPRAKTIMANLLRFVRISLLKDTHERI